MPNTRALLQGFLSRKPGNDLKRCVHFSTWRHGYFIVHCHCPPRHALLTGLHSAPAGHLSTPSRLSKQEVWLSQIHALALRAARKQTREKSESHSLPPSLPLTDANCSLSVNFREPKISSVLFRISASQAAMYALEGNSTVPAFKRSHRNTPLPSHRWY